MPVPVLPIRHRGRRHLTDFDADTLRISEVPALPEGTAHAGIDVIVRVCNKPRVP
jgi:hypothetical protein